MSLPASGMATVSTSVSRKAGSRTDVQTGDASLPAISYERHPGAATDPLPGTYRRREPEKCVLHTVVREHLETFLEQARDFGGEGYPYFIEGEFRRYLGCGILSRGFARLRCPACGHERLVGFSCKGRLCPSCVGRRMADTAAYLVDQLLPEAGYRQWVLTFPWTLRFRLAVDRKLFSALISAFLRTLFAWQRRRGRAIGIRDGQTGAVTFVQRFGGALNLHPHAHSLVPDGLFVPGAEDRLTFVPLPDPTTEQVEDLTLKIARRLTGVVERLCADAFETDALLEKTAASLQQALAAAVKAPVSPSQLGLLGQDPQAPTKPLCARVAGFSLHGAQAVSAGDREALERLCRYGLRPPFAQNRLSVLTDGRVAYRLRRPWPNPLGTSWLLLEPLDFLKRLAALIPAPYTHMIRYHGILANRSQWRELLPEPPPHPSAEDPVDAPAAAAEATGPNTTDGQAASTSTPPRRRRAHLKWAQLLRRVFHLDALKCPQCKAAMLVLAFISDPPVVSKILRHLKLPTTPPPLGAPRNMWEPESYPLIPPMDEHGIDERDLAGTDDGAQIPLRTTRSHPDAARSPPP